MKRIVVIGSGVAGMSAAALLAKRGYDVTVCEDRDVVGGRTRQQVIEGYSLPRGAVSYQLVGALPKIVAEVGVTIDVRPVSKVYFWLKGGDFVELPGKGGAQEDARDVPAGARQGRRKGGESRRWSCSFRSPGSARRWAVGGPHRTRTTTGCRFASG